MRFGKIVMVLLLVLSAISAQAQSSSTFFDKFSNDEKVTSVYISKTMLELAGGSIDTKNFKINSLIGKIEQIEIYTSDDLNTANKMSLEADKYIKKGTFESLMKVRDGGDNIDFLVKKSDKKKDIIEEFIMFISEMNECTFIRIQGGFTMEDIQNIVNESSK